MCPLYHYLSISKAKNAARINCSLLDFILKLSLFSKNNCCTTVHDWLISGIYKIKIVTQPHGIFLKFFRGYHSIWRYGEAQGVQEVQKNTFRKYSTEGIPRCVQSPLTCYSYIVRLPVYMKLNSFYLLHSTIIDYIDLTLGKSTSEIINQCI